MLRHLPNALTCGNLLAGMGGLYLTLREQDLFAAAACMLLAALLDVADGAVARALRVSSPIGKDLDSLADGLTFGILPAFMMIAILQAEGPLEAWMLTPALIAVCAILRLAKFNNDPGQATHFSGLPTPAAALGLLGVAVQYANQNPAEPFWGTTPAAVLTISLAISALMVSPLPLISFKMGFKRLWPYWLTILTLSLASLPLAQGLFTIVAVLAYVLASQLYFARQTITQPPAL